MIAADALVNDGMKVPDNSLAAGEPGEIKSKPFTKRQLWWVETGAQTYLQLAKQYKAEQFLGDVL